MREQCDDAKLIVLIPAYEPDESLATLARELVCRLGGQFGGNAQILIVDDGSTKDSSKVIFATLSDLPNVYVRHHATNMGKGAALKTGVLWAQDMDADVVVTADADGQHLSGDILKVASHGVAQSGMTIGRRAFSASVPIRSRFGNIVTSWLFKWMFKLTVSDTQSGLRSYPASMFGPLLSIPYDRYEFELEALIRSASLGEIEQVDIETVYMPGNPTSYFRPIVDSVLIYSVLLRYTIAAFVITVLDITGFYLMSQILAPVSAFIIVRSISVICYFAVMRIQVFRSRRPMGVQTIQFLALTLLNISIIGLVIHMLNGVYQLSATLIFLASSLLLFVFNFVVQRNIVFGN